MLLHCIKDRIKVHGRQLSFQKYLNKKQSGFENNQKESSCIEV